MTPSGLVRGLPHLARRFIGHYRARALTPSEQDWVAGLLRPGEHSVFWGQAIADQRHGYETARKVEQRLSGDREAVRAGLLHDTGKRHAGIGPLRRSAATVLGAIRTPLPAAWRSYLDHGPVGSSDLDAAGAEPLVVAFARFHPRPAPPGFDTARWTVLLESDDD